MGCGDSYCGALNRIAGHFGSGEGGIRECTSTQTRSSLRMNLHQRRLNGSGSFSELSIRRSWRHCSNRPVNERRPCVRRRDGGVQDGARTQAETAGSSDVVTPPCLVYYSKLRACAWLNAPTAPPRPRYSQPGRQLADVTEAQRALALSSLWTLRHGKTTYYRLMSGRMFTDMTTKMAACDRIPTCLEFGYTVLSNLKNAQLFRGDVPA
jgi:hypothetical protein